MKGIEKNIEKLKAEFKLTIPQEYVDFAKKIEMFQFSWTVVKFGNTEFEINHFLGCSEDSSSQDLYKWYLFADERRTDYLTIAMGFGNEEIAIKAKGDHIGEIELIAPNKDGKVIVEKICDNFNEFVKILKSE
jgi:hypothetical protein